MIFPKISLSMTNEPGDRFAGRTIGNQKRTEAVRHPKNPLGEFGHRGFRQSPNIFWHSFCRVKVIEVYFRNAYLNDIRAVLARPPVTF
jgi:hypothetical protein